jgi:hypothetical protein
MHFSRLNLDHGLTGPASRLHIMGYYVFSDFFTQAHVFPSLIYIDTLTYILLSSAEKDGYPKAAAFHHG